IYIFLKIRKVISLILKVALSSFIAIKNVLFFKQCSNPTNWI
ncbi:unnamed protein product, partial [Heterotrigona itama]